MLILTAIFTNHFNMAKGVLGGSNMRFLAKASPVCCLILIFLIDGIFDSDKMESGLELTFATCLIYGLGFFIAGLLVSSIVLVLFEFPLRRLYQFILLQLHN